MKTTLKNAPSWTVELDEVSAGCYSLIAEHSSGAKIELKGADPSVLLERADLSAEQIEAELQAKGKA